MADEKRIGIIGLDTSHTVAFTKVMQGDGPAEQRLEGLRVVKALRFPSPFQDEDGQDGRQADLEALGVRMVTSVAELAEDVDAIFLEINDPALHLPYFEQVAGLGLPIFVDKPWAANLEEGRKMAEIAAANQTDVWSSSSLRFVSRLTAAREAMETPTVFCNVFGALGKAAAGSDVVWYGVHVTEMLVAAMGIGARTVTAVEGDAGVVAVVEYDDNRRAVAEYNRGSYTYGGRMQAGSALHFFDSAGEVLYRNLLVRIKDWLDTGVVPVPLEETLEVQAIMDKVEASLASGKAEKLG